MTKMLKIMTSEHVEYLISKPTDSPDISFVSITELLSEGMISAGFFVALDFSPEWNDSREFVATLLTDLLAAADDATTKRLAQLFLSC